MEPLTGTMPIPLSIVAFVAFVELQVRIDDCPVSIIAGLAPMFTVGGGGGDTVTVVDAVAVP